MLIPTQLVCMVNRKCPGKTRTRRPQTSNTIVRHSRCSSGATARYPVKTPINVLMADSGCLLSISFRQFTDMKMALVQPSTLRDLLCVHVGLQLEGGELGDN